MRHQKKGFILDRKRGPRTAMIRQLAESLIYHEQIATTHAKARAVQSFVERLITVGKEPTLSHRRKLLSLLPKPKAVSKILEVLSVRYRQRPGGCTRRVRMSRRQGDGADMTTLQFVDGSTPMNELSAKESMSAH